MNVNLTLSSLYFKKLSPLDAGTFLASRPVLYGVVSFCSVHCELNHTVVIYILAELVEF